MVLTNSEKVRYARQMQLADLGEQGQKRLKKARMLIVGAGGLGSPLALYLCGAGVGTIGIIDDDRVAVSNLQRQILYTTDDVDRGKIDVAVEKLSALNPHVNLQPYQRRLDMDNAAEIIGQYDLVADGCDSIATRYLINDVCVALKKTYIYGSVAGFCGQVSVFNHDGGPTYRCLYPEAEKEADAAEPPGVIGALAGVVASFQAAEAIKIICRMGEVLSGQVLLVDLLANRFDKISLSRQYP